MVPVLALHLHRIAAEMAAIGADPMIGIDPTPFTAWGVLGLLAVVVFVLIGIIWKLFNKSTAAIESQTNTLMGFVDKQRSETAKTLNEITDKVALSQDRMTSAFAKMARTLDELVLLERIYDRATKRAGGTPLTEEEIEKIVRRVRSGDRDSTNY